MTLGAWLDTWMELYVIPAKRADSTKAMYRRAVAAVPDQLRQVELEQLSPLDLRRWLLAVAEETPRAAQLDRVMLHRALTVGAKLGLCRPGMVDDDVCPQIDHAAAETAILTADEMHRYMAAAATMETAPVLLLCCCGLRRGEAMGVRWEAVDLRAGTLAIVGQRQTDQLLPLKSAASRRVIALPDQVVTLLASWPRSISGWVCDATQQRVYRDHRRVLAGAGLPYVTLHGLRHSMATMAAMRGEPIKLIQAALGHAHYALTADLYAAHLPPVAAVTGRVFTA